MSHWPNISCIYTRGIYVHLSARYEVSMKNAVTGTDVHRCWHQWWWQWCQWHMMDQSWLHWLIGMYAKWTKNAIKMGVNNSICTYLGFLSTKRETHWRTLWNLSNLFPKLFQGWGGVDHERVGWVMEGVGGSWRGGVGQGGVGWVGHAGVGWGHVGVRWVMQDVVGHEGVGWIIQGWSGLWIIWSVTS